MVDSLINDVLCGSRNVCCICVMPVIFGVMQLERGEGEIWVVLRECKLWFMFCHYSDVIMGRIASQITSLASVYSTVYSGEDQRKHQSSASLAFVRGIHRRLVNSPHKGPVTRKMFPFDDVIMLSYCSGVCNIMFYSTATKRQCVLIMSLFYFNLTLSLSYQWWNHGKNFNCWSATT